MATDSLKKILKKVVRDLKKKKGLTAEGVKRVWEDAAGADAGGHTRPTSFRRSTLFINVDDSGWLYELTTRKRSLVGELSAKLEGKKIKDIRFRIGDIKDERKKS